MSVFCFDVDGVICNDTKGKYERAKPIWKTINIINELYKKGHIIKLFTARGSTTHINWRNLTAKQMTKWGVKHHELIMGKPEADWYIDDRAKDIESLEH